MITHKTPTKTNTNLQARSNDVAGTRHLRPGNETIGYGTVRNVDFFGAVLF